MTHETQRLDTRHSRGGGGGGGEDREERWDRERQRCRKKKGQSDTRQRLDTRHHGGGEGGEGGGEKRGTERERKAGDGTETKERYKPHKQHCSDMLLYPLRNEIFKVELTVIVINRSTKVLLP